MPALHLTRDWQVDFVASAVLRSGAVVSTEGDIDRAVPLASITKILSALTALIAVEEGTIALDDDVPEAGASVRHLLSHASGLAVDERRRQTEPESRRIYSNAGFEVLAEHLASAAQMPFLDYFVEALIHPLGLGRTALDGSPAHGAASSVHDLAVVLGAVLDHRLLAAETTTAMTTPQFPDLDGVLPGYGRQSPNPWGLGVELRGRKSPHWTSAGNSPATWGHFGRAGTLLWHDPAVDVSLIVLTTCEFGAWAVDAWPPLATAVLDEHA